MRLSTLRPLQLALERSIAGRGFQARPASPQGGPALAYEWLAVTQIILLRSVHKTHLQAELLIRKYCLWSSAPLHSNSSALCSIVAELHPQEVSYRDSSVPASLPYCPRAGGDGLIKRDQEYGVAGPIHGACSCCDGLVASTRACIIFRCA